MAYQKTVIKVKDGGEWRTVAETHGMLSAILYIWEHEDELRCYEDSEVSRSYGDIDLDLEWSPR